MDSGSQGRPLSRATTSGTQVTGYQGTRSEHVTSCDRDQYSIFILQLELANRLVNMTKYQQPPVIQKACYVYIYIALRMTEVVTETAGHKNSGFSSCCVTDKNKVRYIIPMITPIKNSFFTIYSQLIVRFSTTDSFHRIFIIMFLITLFSCEGAALELLMSVCLCVCGHVERFLKVSESS